MFRTAITVLLATTAMSASAATFFNNTSGLTGPFTTVDITTPTLSTAALVTTEYSSQGITFSNATYDPQPGFFTGPSIGNFIFEGTIFPDISFTFSPVSAVAFRFLSNPGTSTFDAYLGAALVASTTFDTDNLDTSQWYGVTGGGFNRIVITAGGNAALLATDFQLANVPEPASWAMLIAGFGLTGAAMRRRRHVAVAV